MNTLTKIKSKEEAERIAKSLDRDLRSSKNTLLAQLSVVDKKLSEYYHVIELTDISASKFTKLTMNLKKHLKVRREIKTELKMLEWYNTGSSAYNIENGVNTNRTKAIQEAINKLPTLLQ